MALRHDALSETREERRGKLRAAREEPVTVREFHEDSSFPRH